MARGGWKLINWFRALVYCDNGQKGTLRIFIIDYRSISLWTTSLFLFGVCFGIVLWVNLVFSSSVFSAADRYFLSHILMQFQSNDRLILNITAASFRGSGHLLITITVYCFHFAFWCETNDEQAEEERKRHLINKPSLSTM